MPTCCDPWPGKTRTDAHALGRPAPGDGAPRQPAAEPNEQQQVARREGAVLDRFGQ